jgi:hypothetical protein
MEILGQTDDLIGHAAVHQNPVQPATGTDQQGNAGSRGQAFLGLKG